MLEMIVVTAIITILATVAFPRLAEAIQRAAEGSARANLSVMRHALSFYYGDAGHYPASMAVLPGPYISALPVAKGLRNHPDSAAVRIEHAPSDAGGWSYNNDPLDVGYGTLVINCTHVDEHGKPWASY